MKIIMKIRDRGRRGYDISSVPFKKLLKANDFRKKRWEFKESNNEKYLILDARS